MFDETKQLQGCCGTLGDQHRYSDGQLRKRELLWPAPESSY